ncbi:MAG: DUF1801 domain-containing protein [Rhodospirillaceae bacterium]|nr:DUF1801 domain-containing protein [Rhodospirillaceae bacterium]
MIPKRKPLPGNRKSRRAAGLAPRIKRGGPKGPSGAQLAEQLARAVAANDASVARIDGLMMGERAVMFHRTVDGKSVFAYAVTAAKNRVTLHAMPMYCAPAIHAAFKKRIANGDFGKGCIRFKPGAEMDMNVIAELIRACAAVTI